MCRQTSDPSGYWIIINNWRSLLTAVITISAAGLTVLTMGTAAPLLIVATVAGGVGGFAGGFSGTLLSGGNLGQALVAGVVGGVIGAATGFLSYAAGSVLSTGTNAIFEKAAKHAFVNVWMGGMKSVAYGGELSPIRDMIGGALSSVGDDIIEKDIHVYVLEVASSAVLGGTISEIGGGKFANGAITGAYSFMFNSALHKKGKVNPTVTVINHNIVQTIFGEIDVYTTQTSDGNQYVELFRNGETGDQEAEATVKFKVIKIIQNSNGSSSISVDGISLGIEGNSTTTGWSFRNTTGTGGGFSVKMTPTQLIMNVVLILSPEIRILQTTHLLQTIRSALSF